MAITEEELCKQLTEVNKWIVGLRVTIKALNDKDNFGTRYRDAFRALERAQVRHIVYRDLGCEYFGWVR